MGGGSYILLDELNFTFSATPTTPSIGSVLPGTFLPKLQKPYKHIDRMISKTDNFYLTYVYAFALLRFNIFSNPYFCT